MTTTNNKKWIPNSEITEIKSTQIYNVYSAIRKQTYNYGATDEATIVLVLLGNNEECTPTLARIYSLPTPEYNNDVSQFRRYEKWLGYRNKLIIGFTEYDDNYFMVADKHFYHYYFRYGFCFVCGMLRCSPVWCICGYKELSDGWTSNNKRLDDFIKKTQLQTNSPNHAYLEWIPFDSITTWEYGIYLYGPPTDQRVKLIPLEITDSTHDLYYAEVNYLLMCHVY